MGTRMFNFVEGEYFHIYNRGNSKQKIFHDAYDYQRFMTLLFVSNSVEAFKLFFLKDPYAVERKQKLVSISAYCLMPNHFHILLTPCVEGGVSMFMKKLTTGYSMYFNNKYDRTGALFEGRFKAKLVNDDRYMRYLYAYIHLNPIKLIQSDWKDVGIKDRSGAITYLSKYKYSSYRDIAGESRKEGGIIDLGSPLGNFADVGDFQRNIFDWFETDRAE